MCPPLTDSLVSPLSLITCHFRELSLPLIAVFPVNCLVWPLADTTLLLSQFSPYTGDINHHETKGQPYCHWKAQQPGASFSDFPSSLSVTKITLAQPLGHGPAPGLSLLISVLSSQHTFLAHLPPWEQGDPQLMHGQRAGACQCPSSTKSPCGECSLASFRKPCRLFQRGQLSKAMQQSHR